MTRSIVGEVVAEILGELRDDDARFRRRMDLLSETTSRNVSDAVVHPSVQKALRDAAAAIGNMNVAIIGGLALGAHAQPRYTEDVDVVTMTDDFNAVASKLVESGKFKKIAPHNFQHNDTHVLIELATPDHVKDISPEIAKKLIEDAQKHKVGTATIGVVTVPGLIAAKLGRASSKKIKASIDQGDIMGLLKTHGYQDLSEFPLGDAERTLYEDLWKRTQEAEE